MNIFALDLHGGGDRTVFLVEFFGQYSELADVFHAGQLGIDRVDFGLNQLVDVLIGRQVLVGGERDRVALNE